MTKVSADNGFVEGSHEHAYDARGNFHEFPEGELSSLDKALGVETVEPVSRETPEQVTAVPSEDGGFKDKGGNTRDVIRARIRAARPYKSKTVHVDEWDSDFELRSMTLGDRNAMMTSLMPEGETKADPAKMFPAIIVACTFDEDGEHVFTPLDEGWLNSLDASVVDQLAKPAMELSGMSDKSVDDAAGKSDSTEDAE